MIPVSADPSIAGSAAGNRASGIVPDARLVAFKLVSDAPLIAGSVPVKLAAGMFPEPVILFPLRSKSPPSCGDVSSTTLKLSPVSDDPSPSERSRVPDEVGRVTVAIPE